MLHGTQAAACLCCSELAGDVVAESVVLRGARAGASAATADLAAAALDASLLAEGGLRQPHHSSMWGALLLTGPRDSRMALWQPHAQDT